MLLDTACSCKMFSRLAFREQTISNISSEHGRSMTFTYWHTIFVCTAARPRIACGSKDAVIVRVGWAIEQGALYVYADE